TGGSGTITGVTAGTGLTGGGTSGSVTLGIANGGVGNTQLGANAVTTDKIANGTIATADLADGAVTKAKLAASGGTNGQVLGTDGAGLTWTNAAGFTLPYSGVKNNNADPLFYIVNTGTGPGVRAESSGGAGLYAYSANGQEGVYGASDRSNGYGVLGIAHNGASSAGVYGEGLAGAGVWGATGAGSGVLGQSATGIGVYGNSDGPIGVKGWCSKTGGFGVYGEADATGAMGVFGGSSNGTGVEGSSGSATGVSGIGGTTGVFGDSPDGLGNGVWGHATGGAYAGVRGENAVGYAVTGVSLNQYGVRGDGGNIGVYAHNSTAGGHDVYLATKALAIDAYGDVNVRGNLAKSSGSFRIDHPLDPANKYLAHSFVESPDMMNVYNGNVVTDGDGVAVVELPAYFEALNRNFRYQLTVIGRFAQAIVEQEVKNNRFTIRTNLANVKVSWQVTGIRKDPWANAHRIVVEESKSEADQGNYVHPELYGQPAEKSVGRTDHTEPSERDQAEGEKPATPNR
ncbi:MAG: hypothetical protein ABR961_15725, partial [Thermoanaerobaculaceae bacterium]